MGLFDKMFGSGASAAQAEPSSEQRFNSLKGKYQSVLNVIDQQGVRLQNLHVQDDKLYVKGTASSEDAKNAVWDQLKLVDASQSDITLDIDVQESAHGDSGGDADEYEVQSGDTLSKIAKSHYGDANEYMKIFYANRDQLDSPDMIKVGQKLKVPKA